MTSETDAGTAELRAAHDVLADFYVERLEGVLERMPIERAVLDLFAELTLEAGLGTDVGDIGAGTGRLAPYLAGRGLTPRGVDLSPRMVEVARRDHPGVTFEVGDLRQLPLGDASLAGAVAWYSMIFLAPEDRETAFRELARVVRPGGYLVTAFKDGDGERQRRGRALNLGIEFDAYWMSAAEVERRATEAGFATVFTGSRPADPEWGESTPQGYLVTRRTPL